VDESHSPLEKRRSLYETNVKRNPNETIEMLHNQRLGVVAEQPFAVFTTAPLKES